MAEEKAPGGAFSFVENGSLLPFRFCAGGTGGAEGNHGFAGQVHAFHEGAEDPRGLAPPDGIAQEDGIKPVQDRQFLNLRAGGGIVHLNAGAALPVMVIEVLRGIGLRGLDLKDLRSQGVGRRDGRGADGLLRGEEDHQDTQQHEGHEEKKQFFHKKLLSSTAG